MNNSVRDFSPADFMAFQGDVSIVAIPDSIKLTLKEEILPESNRLVLLEGEVTGHHHSIDVIERPTVNVDTLPSVSDSFVKVNKKKNVKAVQDLMANIDTIKSVGSVKLYRDADAIKKMVDAKILTREDLAIGTLVVEGTPVILRHQEHTSIRIHPGRYIIGRQVESSYAEERRVAD